ncbi:MAG: hypothetical protein JXA10_02880 [Anaerolineae bacterium]|nr:hypothetical protein [Anaerolineae bacterium]
MQRNRKMFQIALTFIVLISTLTAGTSVIQGKSGQTAASGTVVTVIVVDDFSDNLGKLALELSNPSVFNKKAAEVRAAVAQAKKDDAALALELDRILTELKAAYLQESTLNFLGELSARDVGAVSIDPNDSDLCTLNPEGTGIFVAGGTGIFVAGGTGIFVAGGTGMVKEVTHGARVMALLEDLHADYGSFPDKHGDPVTIEFREVDIADFDLANLVESLSAEIAAVQAAHPKDPIIVNMSFGIIPCSAIPTLAIYERLMLSFDQVGTDLDALQALFQFWVDNDVAERTKLDKMKDKTKYDATICAVESAADSSLCKEDKAKGPVLLVGAAGNGPLDLSGGAAYPYYPAAWGEVIAVSGSEDQTADFVTTLTKADWSNSGLVLMPGYWHWTSTAPPVDREEIGTSFAAPRYSYLMALYYANSTADVGCPNGKIPNPVKPYDWSKGTPNKPNEPPC